MRRISCQECSVRHLTCIADLPVADLGDFQGCRVPGLYKPRQVIFHQGTPANGLYILCHGTVKLYQSDRFGREFIIDVAAAGSVLGELGLDDSETYSASAEALTESQLSFLPRQSLVRLIERHPKTAVRLVATLSKTLAGVRRTAGELALKRADARLADLLLRFAEDSRRDGLAGNGPLRIRLAYSRRELAEMIGVSTETAIRLLGKLQRHRLIATNGNEIAFTDLERLARLAHHGDIAVDDAGRSRRSERPPSS